MGLVRTLPLIVLGLVSCATSAKADPGVEVRGSVGMVAFADDGAVLHGLYGGSARLYLNNRLSFEPEFQYLYNSSADKDVVFLLNGAFDFRGRNARIVPYVTGGVGWVHGIRPRFSENETMVSVGVGMKAFLTNRLYISPDFRLGGPIFARVSVAVGWVVR